MAHVRVWKELFHVMWSACSAPQTEKCVMVKGMLYLCRYLYELCLIMIRRPTTWYCAEKLACRSRRATFCISWRRTITTGGRRGSGPRTICHTHCSLQDLFLHRSCWSGRPAVQRLRELNENTLPRLEVRAAEWSSGHWEQMKLPPFFGP